MKKRISFVTTTRQVGQSVMVTIPKDVVELLKIIPDQKIVLNFVALNPITSYKCLDCLHIFDTDDEEDVHCPACDSSRLEVNEESADDLGELEDD